MNKQEVKSDAGKPMLTLVPRKILPMIAMVREFGTKKYGDPENCDDPHGMDSESGLPHLAHLACNISFLCELEDIHDQ